MGIHTASLGPVETMLIGMGFLVPDFRYLNERSSDFTVNGEK